MNIFLTSVIHWYSLEAWKSHTPAIERKILKTAMAHNNRVIARSICLPVILTDIRSLPARGGRSSQHFCEAPHNFLFGEIFSCCRCFLRGNRFLCVRVGPSQGGGIWAYWDSICIAPRGEQGAIENKIANIIGIRVTYIQTRRTNAEQAHGVWFSDLLDWV